MKSEDIRNFSLATALMLSQVVGACGAFPMGREEISRLDRAVDQATCPEGYISEPQLPVSDSARDPRSAPIINCVQR